MLSQLKNKRNNVFYYIKNRIGGGQKRGLAVPEGTSIEDAFNERKPMYEKWAQITIDGTLSVDELVNLIISEN